MMLVTLDYIISYKEFTRNRRTGGYFRVDNSVNIKVK